MTRMSKQAKRRAISPRRPRSPAKKTGPRKDNLDHGFKARPNALVGELANKAFIGKVG